MNLCVTAVAPTAARLLRGACVGRVVAWVRIHVGQEDQGGHAEDVQSFFFIYDHLALAGYSGVCGSGLALKSNMFQQT